jgi:hypothetical protein
VASTANGDLQATLTGELETISNVVNVRASHNSGRPSFCYRIPTKDSSRFVIPRVCRASEATFQLSLQLVESGRIDGRSRSAFNLSGCSRKSERSGRGERPLNEPATTLVRIKAHL